MTSEPQRTSAGRLEYQEFNSGFATLLQNELNSDVARFTIHVPTYLETEKRLQGFRGW